MRVLATTVTPVSDMSDNTFREQFYVMPACCDVLLPYAAKGERVAPLMPSDLGQPVDKARVIEPL